MAGAGENGEYGVVMSAQTASPIRAASTGVFWRYWSATSVSGAGTAVTLVALPLVAVSVLKVSAFQVTLLAAAGQVGWLVLGLPAGVIARRFPLRALQVTMDCLRMAAIGSIPVVWWLGHLAYAYLLLVALIVGCATVIFDVSVLTFLPAIIDKEQLNARNSLISGTLAVNQTGGPTIGGLLVQAVGPVGALVADAVSYLLSAAILRTVPEHRTDAPAGPRVRGLIRAGWLFVVRHPVIFPSMIWAAATNFIAGALIALTPLYLVREAHVSAAVVGIVIATDGVGALFGSLIATKLASALGSARALLLASAVGGLLALMMPLTTRLTDVYFFAIGNIGFAAGTVIGSIVTRTHRQTATPPDMLSRVMATVRFVSWSAAPLGAAACGLLATFAGLRVTLWAVCVGSLGAPVIVFLSRVRGLRDLSDLNTVDAPGVTTTR